MVLRDAKSRRMTLEERISEQQDILKHLAELTEKGWRIDYFSFIDDVDEDFEIRVTLAKARSSELGGIL